MCSIYDDVVHQSKYSIRISVWGHTPSWSAHMRRRHVPRSNDTIILYVPIHTIPVYNNNKKKYTCVHRMSMWPLLSNASRSEYSIIIIIIIITKNIDGRRN